MKMTWSDHWKAMLLLSVIAPMSFLVAFKMTNDPQVIAETIELPIKDWIFQRPYPDDSVDILETLDATYRDSEVHFGFALKIWAFEHYPWEVSGDYLRFGMFINGSLASGIYLQSIEVVFSNDTQPSGVFFPRVFIEPTNLTLTTLKDASDISAFEKVRLKLFVTNNSREVGFKAIGEWAFYDLSPDAEDHQMHVECTYLYYNGTAYKKIVQPFFLGILKSAP